jgi:hypothetical protein
LKAINLKLGSFSTICAPKAHAPLAQKLSVRQLSRHPLGSKNKRKEISKMNQRSIVRKIIVVFLLAFIFNGCASTRDAINAKGTGLYRVYFKPYDSVWTTTLNVIKESSLKIESQDKEHGQIVASTGFQLFVSMGENVAVFISADSIRNMTGVEVVSKKSMSTNVFAKNWETYIINKLDEKLK